MKWVAAHHLRSNRVGGARPSIVIGYHRVIGYHCGSCIIEQARRSHVISTDQQRRPPVIVKLEESIG